MTKGTANLIEFLKSQLRYKPLGTFGSRADTQKIWATWHLFSSNSRSLFVMKATASFLQPITTYGCRFWRITCSGESIACNEFLLLMSNVTMNASQSALFESSLDSSTNSVSTLPLRNVQLCRYVIVSPETKKTGLTLCSVDQVHCFCRTVFVMRLAC